MIHLNIGSNLNSNFGNRFQNISIAVDLLSKLEIKIIKISNFYETPSYPNKNLPKFINIAAMIETKLEYKHLLKETLKIENKLGRSKSKKNDPRTCDIDIVDFKGLVIKEKEIILPHPRCHLRNFVLYPILEIDPNWRHPFLKKNVDFLINQLSQSSRIEITRLNKSVIIKL